MDASAATTFTPSADPATRARELRSYLRRFFTDNPEQCWDTITKRMHHGGELYALQMAHFRAEYEAAYLAADGFGTVDRAFAEEQCWDWSHVRDSSDAALVNVALALVAGDKAVGLA